MPSGSFGAHTACSFYYSLALGMDDTIGNFEVGTYMHTPCWDQETNIAYLLHAGRKAV